MEIKKVEVRFAFIWDLRANFFFLLLSFLFLLFVLFLLISFCAGSQNKFIKVYFPNGKSVTAELAITDQERAVGLMFRESLSSDQGMLFIFEEEGYYSFWMKNMKFAIDIIWIDENKRILHIEEKVLPCRKEPCPSYLSSLPARYVLELVAGKVKEENLKIYDQLDFIIPSLD
ncbi:MAG: DUF192 domain-containing protein [Candidatus Aminicenantia bacterium]